MACTVESSALARLGATRARASLAPCFARDGLAKQLAIGVGQAVERRERVLEKLASLAHLEWRLRVVAGVRPLVARRRHAPALDAVSLTPPLQGLVGADAPDPGSQGGSGFELADSQDDFQEGSLDDVGRCVGISRDPFGQAEQGRAHRIEHRAERSGTGRVADRADAPARSAARERESMPVPGRLEAHAVLYEWGPDGRYVLGDVTSESETSYS